MRKTLVCLMFCSLAFGKDHWDGKGYSKNSEEQHAAAQNLIRTIPLLGHEKVLDIGSGDGFTSSLLAEKLSEGSIVGLDISPSMVAFASENYPLSNLSFRALDALKLDYQSEFDLVVSFTTLQWIPDQLSVLQRIGHALKPGGKMVVEMPMGLPDAMKKAVAETMIRSEWASYFLGFSPGWRFFTAEEYRDLLKEASLTPVRVEVFPAKNLFPSRQAYIGFLKQWFPFLRPLPDALKDPFLDQVVDAYLKLIPSDADGKVHFDIGRLRVEAQKEGDHSSK